MTIHLIETKAGQIESFEAKNLPENCVLSWTSEINGQKIRLSGFKREVLSDRLHDSNLVAILGDDGNPTHRQTIMCSWDGEWATREMLGHDEGADEEWELRQKIIVWELWDSRRG